MRYKRSKIRRIREGRRFIHAVANYIKEEGYAAFLNKLFKAIISPLFRYHKTVIVVKEINDPIRDCEARKKVKYSYLGYQDRERLFDVMYDDKKTIEERLKSGHLCCIGEIDGEIASYHWITFADEYIPEVDKVLKLKEGEEVYIYNYSTLKRFRGKYLFPALVTNILKYLKENNYKRVYGAISVKNRPSLKTARIVGFKESHTITYVKILWLKRYCYRDLIQKKDKGAEEIGYQTAKQS